MSIDTDAHSHLPDMFDQMNISHESVTMLRNAAGIEAMPQTVLRVIDNCIEHEEHRGNLQGILELLEHRRELMHAADCPEAELAANAIRIQDVALKQHAQSKPERKPVTNIPTLVESKKSPFRTSGARRRSRKW